MTLLPKKIDPDNLIETIIEIRMISKCPSELWAGIISANMQELGYEYIPAPQLNIRLDKNGKMDVSMEKGNKNITHGIFVKDSIRFVMQGDSLSFNCERGHYVGWEVYQKEITDVISALKNCEIAQTFNRVQIRYISEYLDIDIIDHINGNINIGNNGLFKNQEIKLSRTEENMKVFISLINKVKIKRVNGEERESSLFDVNIYENFDDSDSVEFVIEKLDNIHKTEKETFFGLLTDDFIKTLNPKY